jgi:hypothetical protein
MCANKPSDEILLPFASYPARGRKLLGRPRADNCRHGYGLELLRLTGRTQCAYCDTNLVDTYEHWLTLSTDHVVPVRLCKDLGIPEDWQEDRSNRVICCLACNTFRNRYTPANPALPTTLEQFYKLRDRFFCERKKCILESRQTEQEFFKTKPWLVKST